MGHKSRLMKWSVPNPRWLWSQSQKRSLSAWTDCFLIGEVSVGSSNNSRHHLIWTGSKCVWQIGVCASFWERAISVSSTSIWHVYLLFIYWEINEWVTPCVHQDSSKAVSLGLWMEEMIFNLADSRLFFNDLEVSRFITWPQPQQHRSVLLWKPISNRCRVSLPLQLECIPSVYFSPKAFYCIELHYLPLVSTLSPIAP